MKFFLDENFPRPALAQLQSAGHTAVHALEIFPPGTADDHLFAHAQQEQSVFVTTDKDFFHTIPLGFAAHHGAIVITLRRPNRDELLAPVGRRPHGAWRKKFNQHRVAHHRRPHL